MSHIVRTFFLVATFGCLGFHVGCGGGNATPDVPATLTPEQEQEILDQVEGAAAQEAAQS